ncbi:proton-coupled folate transporter-like [Parasteatoda tepidariorum]|uniref:proton-coupled folate transporter-like n=1 Tax=Parasteatoda tepidariorum TaxID=114398 RepID=UPI001C723AE8|nr:proton-coupled folate transporter-like [Parasteatoda tepidariorum]
MEKSPKTFSNRIVCLLRETTVEPFIFFTALGLFTTMLPLQSLLMDRACRNMLMYNETICDELDHHKEVQEKSIEIGNNVYTWVMLTTSLPSCVIAVFVGPWSDKYSRKIPLIIGVSGLLTESIVMLLLTFSQGAPPTVYIGVAAISGVSGGILVCFSISNSYLSDVTDERSRPTRYAIMSCCLIAATVLGNVIGGQLFASYGYVAVLSISPCFYVCALIYAVLALKETITPHEKNRLGILFDFFTFENIKESYRTCVRKRSGNLRLQIWLLIFVDTCSKFVELGNMGIQFAFLKHVFKMGVEDSSNANIIFSVCNALGTILVVPILIEKLRLHEAALGLIGILSFMSRMVLTSVSDSPTFFYLAMVSGSLFNCSTIAVSSRLSKLVNKEELGKAFSLLWMFSTLAPMLGTAVFLQIYNASLNSFPGLVFVLASIFLCPSAIVFGWMMKLPTISVGEFAREEKVENTLTAF